MGWDAKGGHSRYYYRSIREGDRVRKVYVGRGQQAENLARQVEQRRQERQAQREARHREFAEVASAEEKLRELHDLADLLMRAVLLGTGLHEHRGLWRRRRYGRDGHQDPGR
jgi:hypothetical protein